VEVLLFQYLFIGAVVEEADLEDLEGDRWVKK
jgi:hypothetical protein